MESERNVTNNQTDTTPSMEEMAQGKPMPSAAARSLAEWIHAHKGATSSHPVGYLGYQYVRSAVASVPYGFSMALTYLGFNHLSKKFKAMPSAKRLGSPAYYASAFFSEPIMQTGAMIGTSFTLYRATSKIGKWVNEYLFNPEDSLETTIEKVQQLPAMLKEKAKEVYLPEAHSTLISAFVLSALVTIATERGAKGKHLEGVLKDTKAALEKNGYFNWDAWKGFWKEGIINPKAEFVPQAAINALGYSLFFELGDRRFKDKQMSRGMWAGRAHSIGSSSKSHPSLLQPTLEGEEQIQPEQSDPSSALSYDDLTLKEKVGELPAGSRMGDTLSVLTSEPSALRFALRRFIPTAIGIAIYTAIKFRAAPLFLGKFKAADVMNGRETGALETLRDVPRHAWREGAATSLFFAIPWITDKYAPAFDKVVNSMEAAVSGRTYDEVVAGYQPKRASQPETMLAQDTPSPKVQTAQAQARLAESEHKHVVSQG